MRVLLVEDNPGDARLLQDSLSEAGDGAFNLTHAGRLAEGLEYLCGGEFDIVLLDLSLPDSQGLETFSTTHALAPQVAIVVLTGLADDELAAAALREGAQDYLVKGQLDSNLLARSIRYAAQRKRSEEALRESEERYRSLFANSMDAIFISGPDGGVIDANQAALDLFGFTSQEALASGVGDRYADPADRDRFRDEVASTGFVKDFEVRLLTKDGTEMDCLLTATRMAPEDGGHGGVEGIVRDITEHKEADRAMKDNVVLEERNRMAREIHDTLAQGFTGIVLQLEAAEQALEESSADAVGHLRRAKGLARESLQEARRSVWDLLPRALEQGSLDQALREEVERFPTLGGEKVTFAPAGEPMALPLKVQIALLRICQESLTNVRRHAGATEVAVGLAFLPGSVQLQVRDNGTGLEPRKAAESGRGGSFGLIGMEQRARALGGSFSVTSKPGEGTLIEVRLPIR